MENKLIFKLETIRRKQLFIQKKKTRNCNENTYKVNVLLEFNLKLDDLRRNSLKAISTTIYTKIFKREVEKNLFCGIFFIAFQRICFQQ